MSVVFFESIAHTVVFKTRLSTGHENENRTIEQMNHHNGFEIVDRRLKNIDVYFCTWMKSSTISATYAVTRSARDSDAIIAIIT